MGHADIETTQKYATLNLEDIVRKHKKFNPLKAAYAAAQESFLDEVEAIQEAEAILKARSSELERGDEGNG